VALTLNFAGPVEDGPFIISARPVRTNRSTQHWVIELRQGDLVAVTATAFFATRRDTWADTEARFPSVPAPEEVARMAPISWAAWTHNYDMRVVRGGLDQMATQGPGLEESLTQLWIRDEPPRALDFPALAAICDAFFPRLFLRRPKMVAVGTVSLTIYFHADADSLALHGDPAVLGIARGLNFRRGYFDQAAEIWSRDGTMLASSHQVVYYKE
jgi:acyl-CoA thioesterase